MSRNYKFHNPDAAYFVSFAVVDWLDVFTRNEYKNILIDSLNFCQREKGMEIYAWCIMTNHVHLVFRSTTSYKPELLLGDFKRFTSRAIVKAIAQNPNESRKEDLLRTFSLRSEEHTSELQSRENLVCRLLLEKKKKIKYKRIYCYREKKDDMIIKN